MFIIVISRCIPYRSIAGPPPQPHDFDRRNSRETVDAPVIFIIINGANRFNCRYNRIERIPRAFERKFVLNKKRYASGAIGPVNKSPGDLRATDVSCFGRPLSLR